MCIFKNSEVITTSGNVAAVLDFRYTVTSHEIGNATTRKLDPKKHSASLWNFDDMSYSFGYITASG